MELFGTPSTNVKYAKSVMNEMKAQGHIMHIKFTTRRETLKNIKRLVILEELLRRKYLDNSVLNTNEQKVFWNNWKNKNQELIIDKLGRKDDCAQYLHGIYFTPLFAPKTVPEMKRPAITSIMDKTGHFHCAHHRRGNIIKMCGLKSGTRVYSALWVYNRLVGCRMVEAIEKKKDKYMSMMHVKDAQYLNNLEDAEPHPAARCAQGRGIYMYHRSTSAAVELMNAANCEMRAKTALDPLNACILLMKLECKGFSEQRAKAWLSDSFLMPRGTVKYEEVFKGINALDFTITIVSRDESYECTVCRNMMSSRNPMGKVVVLKQPAKGLFFGTCTCGVDKRDLIPCEHMTALVVSSRVPDITRHNIMPYWWTTAQWKSQFPLDTVAHCNTNMAMIHEDHEPSGNYRYCPDWSSPNKAGRPKKNERRKSVLETAGGKRG
jgi:hypothetical protein